MHKTRYAKGKQRLKKGEYQRANGTFEFRWSDQFGRNYSIYEKTLSDLRAKEEAILRDLADGISFSEQRLTLNSYFELWKQLKTGIRESTLSSYVKPYRLYVETQIGNTKLKDITYSSLVIFYKRLAEEKGLSLSTIININKVISMILDVAVRDGVIRNNPCVGALKDIRRQYADSIKTVSSLTVAEQKLFEEYLEGPGPYHYLHPVFTVMLWTGMRVGEVLALRWEDIDLDNNKIYVRHTLENYDRGKGLGCVMAIAEPKTKTSIRVVPMFSKVKTAFLEEKQKQEDFGVESVSVISGYSDFIFVDEDGVILDYRKLNNKLCSITTKINEWIRSKDDAYGVKEFPHVHNHMLRHTFTTRMNEAGMDIKALAAILGHKDVKITLNTYTDATEAFKTKQVCAIEKYYCNGILD